MQLSPADRGGGAQAGRAAAPTVLMWLVCWGHRVESSLCPPVRRRVPGPFHLRPDCPMEHPHGLALALVHRKGPRLRIQSSTQPSLMESQRYAGRLPTVWVSDGKWRFIQDQLQPSLATALSTMCCRQQGLSLKMQLKIYAKPETSVTGDILVNWFQCDLKSRLHGDSTCRAETEK